MADPRERRWRDDRIREGGEKVRQNHLRKHKTSISNILNQLSMSTLVQEYGTTIGIPREQM
jgi:hypothetical protein